MTITSKPATKEYSDNFERIFGMKKQNVPAKKMPAKSPVKPVKKNGK